MKILVLNSGSSSQKSALFELGDSLPQDPPEPLWQAKIEWGEGSFTVQVRNARGAALNENKKDEQRKIDSRASAIRQMLETLWSGPAAVLHSASEIDVVGHRIVHGGGKLTQATEITPEVKRIIASVAASAPLHNRGELEGIEIIEKLAGQVRQVAVFDTAFHHTLPPAAAVYPGPYEWFESGIRRYGFHGINHQYCAHRAAHLLQRDPSSVKIVSCHLGNGCSLAAIRGGRSVDTTMGFTPLDGLMMGTRSGSVDPGILTYLLRRCNVTGQQLDDILNKKSGLLGVSGISGDVREIVAAMGKGNERAKLAFDIYVHRLQSGVGAMAAVLAGIDVLIFTAGVGEHSPEVRAATCDTLGFLGIQLDAERNAKSPADAEIAGKDSRVKVLIVRAQEDWAIAAECWKLVGAAG